MDGVKGETAVRHQLLQAGHVRVVQDFGAHDSRGGFRDIPPVKVLCGHVHGPGCVGPLRVEAAALGLEAVIVAVQAPRVRRPDPVQHVSHIRRAVHRPGDLPLQLDILPVRLDGLSGERVLIAVGQHLVQHELQPLGGGVILLPLVVDNGLNSPLARVSMIFLSFSLIAGYLLSS